MVLELALFNGMFLFEIIVCIFTILPDYSNHFNTGKDQSIIQTDADNPVD